MDRGSLVSYSPWGHKELDLIEHTGSETWPPESTPGLPTQWVDILHIYYTIYIILYYYSIVYYIYILYTILYYYIIYM